MKRILTPAGLLCIGISIALSSCVSNKKLETSRPMEGTMTTKLKHLEADSLVNFKEDSSGTVFVSVQGKILFKPGSALIEHKGQKALQPLALMLYGANDFTIMIKGCTDTVALKEPKYVNNWSLSQARAASIMSVLITTMRDKAEADKAAEQKALAKKPGGAKNEPASETISAEPAIIPSPQDSTKYVVILLNSL